MHNADNSGIAGRVRRTVGFSGFLMMQTFNSQVDEIIRKSKLKRKIRIISSLCLAVIFTLVIIPFGCEYVIFRSDAYSVLSNGEWAGFLGSYIGGAMGGIGTLLAVYITTKETRKIQAISDQHFIEEKNRNKEKERKEFTNEIAQTISAYITDILKYAKNLDKLYFMEEKRRELKNKLLVIRDSIDKCRQTIKQSPHLTAYIKKEQREAKKDYQQFLLEEKRIKFDIEYIDKEISGLKQSRFIADQSYYLLKIQLDGIFYAKKVVEKLEFIQEFSKLGFFFEFSILENEVKELLQLTTQFISAYLEEDNFIILDWDDWFDNI